MCNNNWVVEFYCVHMSVLYIRLFIGFNLNAERFDG